MKTEFKGKPLIELPKDIPQIDFLEGNFGAEFLAEYLGKVEKDYKNNPNLIVLIESNSLVTGSNVFAVVLANQILFEQNLRTATQADLERVLKLGTLNLSGTYEDIGLILRTEAEPNIYLARDLSRQLKARNLKIEYPVLINLTNLELKADQDSNYGLSFRLKEDAVPIYASILNKQSIFNSEDIDEFTGLPGKTGTKGERYLYTRASGLSCLCLNWGLDLGSNCGGLAGSDSKGRVVVVSGAAAQKISK